MLSIVVRDDDSPRTVEASAAPHRDRAGLAQVLEVAGVVGVVDVPPG